MIHKHSELIVVGIVIFFALGGLFFMFTDNARTSDLFEQNTQYAKHSVVYPEFKSVMGNTFSFGSRSRRYRSDSASAQQFIPVLGGRGRRYIEDTASAQQFVPVLKGKSRKFAADAG